MKTWMLIIMAVCIGILASGCMTPQGKRFGQSLMVDYARAGVIRNAQNSSNAYYAAKERQRQARERERQARERQAREKVEIVTLEWTDRNNDRNFQRGEVGRERSYFDLNKTGVHISVRNVHGNIRYTLLNNRTGREQIFVSPGIILYMCQIEPGEYFITAEGTNFYLQKTIILRRF